VHACGAAQTRNVHAIVDDERRPELARAGHDSVGERQKRRA
jgi:hypothetical protein